MMGGARAAIAIGLLALAGCSHAPRVEVASTGRWPVAGAPSFGFGHPVVEDDAALRARIGTCLGGKGMTASVTPAYLVQIGFSDRPAGSDVILAEPAGAVARRPAARRRSQSLAVSITDVADGREVYRVQATEHYRRVSARQPVSALAEADCRAIGAPPPSRGS